jgi:hypothetical protein
MAKNLEDTEQTSNTGELRITAFASGVAANAITVTDAKGNVLNITVSSQAIHVQKLPTIDPISINPQASQIDFIGGSVTLNVSGGGTNFRKIGWLTSGGTNAFTVDRPGPTSGDPENITFYAKQGGYYHGKISGGPATQPETEFWISVNTNTGGNNP